MEKNKVDLRFIICDFEDISHDEISELTEIIPSYVLKKGEKKNSKNVNSPLWDTNLWAMNAGLDEYASFESQMNEILNKIEAKRNVFEMLCSKYYSEFACAITTYKDNGESTPWIHLNKRYNKIAGELNIEFDVDLYCW